MTSAQSVAIAGAVADTRRRIGGEKVALVRLVVVGGDHADDKLSAARAVGGINADRLAPQGRRRAHHPALAQARNRRVRNYYSTRALSAPMRGHLVCRKYSLQVPNMDKCWRDGVLFNALVHRCVIAVAVTPESSVCQ